MRIVSNKKDYYDSIAAYGVDTERVYVRTEEIISDKVLYSEFIETIKNKKNSNSHNFYHSTAFPKIIGLDNIFIGFCGKIYPMMQFNNAIETNVKNYYNYDSIDKSFLNNKSLFYSYKESELRNYFIPFEYEDIFHKLNCPVFVFKRDINTNTFAFFKNCMINQYGFQKIVDPFKAYMDIQTYISDILCMPKKIEPVKIKDIDMLQKKGFDKKTSFRKQKGE